MTPRHALHKALALAALLAAGAATASSGTDAEPAGAAATRAFFRVVTESVRVQRPTHAHLPPAAAGVRG